MRIEIKASSLRGALWVLVLALTFGIALILDLPPAADANRALPSSIRSTILPEPLGGQAQQGHNLFERNCAHCHGTDARGDEGPTLYNLALSSQRIATRIKEGIKGEMPRFGGKFNQADIAALIAYVRTLND